MSSARAAKPTVAPHGARSPTTRRLRISSAPSARRTTSSSTNVDDPDLVKIECDLEFSEALKTRETRLRLIFENLISNALKYRDLKKEQPYVKIITRVQDNKFIFEVEDNGLGVPENQRHKLFSMFSRFHPQSSYGTGLGLYMVKKSAELIKGEIIYRDTDQGSVFGLAVPINS